MSNYHIALFLVKSIILAIMYLIKVNNTNTRTMSEIHLFKVNNKYIITRSRHYNEVALELSQLTLTRFHILPWCFHRWLWRSTCQLGMLSKKKKIYSIVLVLLTRFHILFSCFHCWIWTSKCRSGCFFVVVNLPWLQVAPWKLGT